MPTSKKAVARMAILGIDPGYADLGYGVITVTGSRIDYRDCGNVRSPAAQPMPERLLNIDETVAELIARYKPSLVAIEQLFIFRNQKSVMAVAQARGVVLACVARHGIPIVEYTPPQIKQSLTSHGQAEKRQVKRMVETLLRIPPLKKKDDAIDALATAVCAAFRRNKP